MSDEGKRMSAQEIDAEITREPDSMYDENYTGFCHRCGIELPEERELCEKCDKARILGTWRGCRVEFYMPIHNAQKLKKVVNCLIADSGVINYPACGGCEDKLVCGRVIDSHFNMIDA